MITTSRKFKLQYTFYLLEQNMNSQWSGPIHHQDDQSYAIVCCFRIYFVIKYTYMCSNVIIITLIFDNQNPLVHRQKTSYSK